MTSPSAVDVTAYTGDDPRLDGELAQLAYHAVIGWPDQRPITTALVRSRLRAPDGGPPTVLATLRTARGRLVGAAALRHPAGPGALGRVWGPVVDLAYRRRGVGRALLAALPAAVCDVTTAEIPAARTAAGGFFTTAGWRPGPRARLLKRVLPVPFGLSAAALSAHDGRDLTGPLERLFTLNRPHLGPATARDTARRWMRDERFTPAGLWTAADPGGQVIGAALVYPLQHHSGKEPSEALLADLLVADPGPAADPVRAALAAEALNAAHLAGARVARCVAEPCMDPRGVLVGTLGFDLVDTLTCYRPGAPA